jgi:Mn2+/Fe2+ NRAMP family transporter
MSGVDLPDGRKIRKGASDAIVKFVGANNGSVPAELDQFLMINAAVLGTTAVSLASSWAYGEVRGWPHSLQLPLKQAPGFYSVYIFCILAAAGLVLIPNAPLQLIILSVQVLAGLILPSAINRAGSWKAYFLKR